MKPFVVIASLIACLGTSSISPLYAAPLDSGSWLHVARMADGDAGMFDGNGELLPTYSFGTYSSTLQSTDFQIPFSVYDGMKILFITGDQRVWGEALYSDLRTLIDARAVAFAPNITFNASINGVAQTTTGNVLSRNGFSEDPWISLSGDHGSGIANSLIIWGESDYAGPHTALKNAHGGVNVYVSVETVETPVPAALPLFASALIGGGVIAWRKKQKQKAVSLTA